MTPPPRKYAVKTTLHARASSQVRTCTACRDASSMHCYMRGREDAPVAPPLPAREVSDVHEEGCTAVHVHAMAESHHAPRPDRRYRTSYTLLYMHVSCAAADSCILAVLAL